MPTGVLAPTGLVVTVKVAVVLPATTVTLPGTCATVILSLVSATTVPPAGAALLNTTVPVDEFPPRTLVGFSVTEPSVVGVTVKPADWVAPYVPEMLASVEDDTGMVVTLKSAVIAPPATVTFAGTCAALLLLANVTTAPPVGAAPFRVTVPVEFVPPTTEVGFNDRPDRLAAVTIRVAA